METDYPQQKVTSYYNELAARYDGDRFGNSYGQYLHRQESYFLKKLDLTGKDTPVLSMGCGTGRFMEIATHGIDISEAMIARAGAKFPGKLFRLCSITDTQYPAGFFAGAFLLHVLMHLPPEKAEAALEEAHRIVKPGGWLVIDFPNNSRRRQKTNNGWHGATGFTMTAFSAVAAAKGWTMQQQYGLLLFPVHRLPVWLRQWIRPLDTMLCCSFLKRFASYYIIRLEK